MGGRAEGALPGGPGQPSPTRLARSDLSDLAVIDRSTIGEHHPSSSHGHCARRQALAHQPITDVLDDLVGPYSDPVQPPRQERSRL